MTLTVTDKYCEISDRELRRHLESMFADEYREGFNITGIARLGDQWVVKWERDLRPK